MIQELKVSVIVKVYNHEKFIRDALKSILSQSYQNLEILVCDDGSKDKSQEIINEIAAQDSRIVPLFFSENKGLCANFNRGLANCKGQYICILDGDDLMLPGKIEKQVNVLNNYTDVVICSHDMEVFDNSDGRKLFNFSDKYLAYSHPVDSIFFTNWFLLKKEFRSCPSSMMFRAGHYAKFIYDPRCPVLSEFLHGIDMYAGNPLGKWHTLPEVLGKWRKHASNMSSSSHDGSAGLEEIFIVYGIAAARYPQLAKKIKNQLDFWYFRALLFGWVPESLQILHEKQFQIRAGLLKYVYLKLAQLYVRNSAALHKIYRPIKKILLKA